MDMYFNLGSLISAVAFLLLGLVVFVAAFKSVVKMAVTTFREEILQERNVALAILVGMMSLSLSIIIAAAVH